MILVVGATGLLGSEICRRLRERKHPVRGLVREGSSREAQLAEQGVEIARGDLKSPASLRLACAGTAAVITTANSMISRRAGDSLRSVDRDGHLALIDAARAAGVNRFVYTSVSPNLSMRATFVRYKREVEVAVRQAGMSWTILQPSAFMEISFSRIAGWDHEAARAMICGPGSSRVSYISVADVAQGAVLALERPELENLHLPLGGPEALSPLDAVRTFEAVAGRRYAVKRIPGGLLQLMGRVLERIDPIKSSLLSMVAETAAEGDEIEQTSVRGVSDLKPLTTVRAYAERTLTLRPVASQSLS